MPITERWPHYVKTRKEHKCALCHRIIPIGAQARSKNGFDKKHYYHEYPPCPQEAFEEMWAKVRKINDEARQKRESSI